MNAMAKMTVTTAFGAALGLIGATNSQSALAGSLDKCDEMHIAAHNTIMNRYRQLLSELDDQVAQATSRGTDPGKLPYRDADDQLRSVDMTTLKSDLQRQEAKDAGRAEREAARNCGADGVSVQDVVKAADAIATSGMSTLLPKHMANVAAKAAGPRQP